MPAVGFNELKKECVAQRFNQHSSVIKIDELVTIIDPYANSTNLEVMQLKTGGIIELWQAILHCEILSYIYDEMAKDAEFLNKELAEIRSILEQRAKDKANARNANNADALLGKIATG